ncbi:MAG: AmmeMemoRadiSam system protein B [Gammaproteobacteria bacterium]|nr:AmmeMemoRadiSam system protein B [Gammaproteobacteria bacterium]
MERIRPPAVAGMFYPRDTGALRMLVDTLLAGAATPALMPKAIIAPHAGYVYSGPVAASAYALLTPLRDLIRKVVLLGPCHRAPLHGLAAPGVDFFSTPLGTIPIDQAAITMLLRLPCVQHLDAPHASEHSLEVQLPFLQRVLGDFTLIPLVVGNTTATDVAQVLELLWGGPETLIIISSDLSHYLDYQAAQHLDRTTSQAIEALDDTAIGHDQACGRVPVCGLLQVAQRHGLHGQLLDLRNSGDTAGPRDRVVGYGAYAFS